MDLADFPNTGIPNAPNVRSIGVFRHELGHILGLRHEHVHPSSGAPGSCAEGGPWRSVTGYDKFSVMHYPWCNGVMTSDLSITSADALGVNKLYGGATGNLATGKPVTQSSTVLGADASRAIDRNVDGNWGGNSVTHTDYQYRAWWQVDLGVRSAIGTVVIYNRTDCCGERLADFNIEVSDDGANWSIAKQVNGPVFGRTSHALNSYGRYLRVQLGGTNYLSLAEVQVFEPSRVIAARNVFGGNWFAQDFFYTTPQTCTPGFMRTSAEVVWSSHAGGHCTFLGWAAPGDPRNCQANIHARTGGGGFGGQCRVWVRQTPAP
jgi:hypothetical protein